MPVLRFSADIKEAAAFAGINADLFGAQVITESGGNPWAWNPEPRYRYFWNVKLDAPFRPVTAAEVASKVPPIDFAVLAGDRDQEFWGQQVSWGLCQIMGAVARERGFKGPYLTELLRPDLNLAMGASLMRELIQWANGGQRQALAAYNGGKGAWNQPGPLAYADKILALAASWGM